jgi:hypothetical protein
MMLVTQIALSIAFVLSLYGLVISALQTVMLFHIVNSSDYQPNFKIEEGYESGKCKTAVLAASTILLGLIGVWVR